MTTDHADRLLSEAATAAFDLPPFETHRFPSVRALAPSWKGLPAAARLAMLLAHEAEKARAHPDGEAWGSGPSDMLTLASESGAGSTASFWWPYCGGGVDLGKVTMTRDTQVCCELSKTAIPPLSFPSPSRLLRMAFRGRGAQGGLGSIHADTNA